MSSNVSGSCWPHLHILIKKLSMIFTISFKACIRSRMKSSIYTKSVSWFNFWLDSILFTNAYTLAIAHCSLLSFALMGADASFLNEPLTLTDSGLVLCAPTPLSCTFRSLDMGCLLTRAIFASEWLSSLSKPCLLFHCCLCVNPIYIYIEMYSAYKGYKALKGLTVDRRTFMSQMRARGQDLNNDSDLPDEIIFEIARTDMEEAYAKAKEPGNPVVLQSYRFPYVAVVRGTDNLDDLKTDAFTGLTGIQDANFKRQVEEVKAFLAEHPEVQHVIGHSLGGAVAQEATKDNPNVKTVGLDAARVLNTNEGTRSRNINTDSKFDMLLDPVGVPEMKHEFKRWFNADTPSGRVGHRSWEAPYKNKYSKAKGDPRAMTGFYDGQIRYVSVYAEEKEI